MESEVRTTNTAFLLRGLQVRILLGSPILSPANKGLLAVSASFCQLFSLPALQIIPRNTDPTRRLLACSSIHRETIECEEQTTGRPWIRPRLLHFPSKRPTTETAILILVFRV